MKKIILFIEESDIDFEVAKRAFRKHKRDTKIIRCKDAVEFMAMITKVKQDTLNPKDYPHIIFLDLDSALFHAPELLKEMRRCEPFKRTPIIVLSGTQNTDDIIESYEKGANSFMRKTKNYDELVANFDAMKTYWLDVAEMPPPFSPEPKRIKS